MDDGQAGHGLGQYRGWSWAERRERVVLGRFPCCVSHFPLPPSHLHPFPQPSVTQT